MRLAVIGSSILHLLSVAFAPQTAAAITRKNRMHSSRAPGFIIPHMKYTNRNNRRAHLKHLSKTRDIELLELSTSRNQTKDTADKLGEFFRHLQSFIGVRGLDTFRFDVMAKRLAQDVTEIVDQGAVLILDNKILSRQLSTAARMFEHMMQSMRDVEELGVIGTTEALLVINMIHLNVRLWEMYDCYGVLDPAMKNVAETLRGFSSEVQLENRKFRDLASPCSEMGHLFDNEVVRAESTIRSLWAQLFGSPCWECVEF
ncbi:hypothetical protein JCM33374_g6270 [Metschnikowia sp. JCM 33374]|nr:hypothetical protein JCM33374_g6270 [Metschnikowia sp. JCM 33374]